MKHALLASRVATVLALLPCATASQQPEPLADAHGHRAFGGPVRIRG